MRRFWEFVNLDLCQNINSSGIKILLYSSNKFKNKIKKRVDKVSSSTTMVYSCLTIVITRSELTTMARRDLVTTVVRPLPVMVLGRFATMTVVGHEQTTADLPNHGF